VKRKRTARTTLGTLPATTLAEALPADALRRASGGKMRLTAYVGDTDPTSWTWTYPGGDRLAEIDDE
jgi:hypothetical protein